MERMFRYEVLWRLWALVGVLVACPSLSVAQSGRNMTVSNGWELHTAMATPDVTQVYIAANITLTLDTCPFPASGTYPATLITRNVTVASLPAAAAAAAAAAGSQHQDHASDTMYWINCNYMTDRFEIQPGCKITLENLVLLNCRTYSLAGIFRKAAGSAVHLDSCIENFGQVCLPGLPQYRAIASAPRPPTVPPPGVTTDAAAVAAANDTHQQPQQWVRLTNSSYPNWCAAHGYLESGALGFPFRSPLPADNPNPMCRMQALLLGDLAVEMTALNTSEGTPGQAFIFQATNTAAICQQPIPETCLRGKTPEECLLAAYEAVNPDTHAPCRVTDGFSLHNCLVTPSVDRIMLLQSAVMNLSTCPAQEEPGLITRDVTIFSDLRAPRMTWDCGLLSNRVQLAPNKTLTLNHIILANCSTPKPVSIVRMSAGSRVLINDTIVLQPPGLCLPLEDQGGLMLHNSRPANATGTQSLRPAQGGTWCQHNDSATTAQHLTGPTGNTSYMYNAVGENENDLGLLANTTGFGLGYAATLADVSSVPNFVHSSWPAKQLCDEPAFLLIDYAYLDPHGWVPSDHTVQGVDQQEPGGQRFGSDVDLKEGSYNGTFQMQYVNSAVQCLQPVTAASCPGVDPRNGTGCLAVAYEKLNPDRLMLPGAAAYAAAAAAHSRNDRVSVALPALLGSVLGAALLAAIIAGALYVRRRRMRAKSAKEAVAAAKPKGWLDGTPTNTTASSNDPARFLLAIHQMSREGSADTARTHGTGTLAKSAPDGIMLSMLLGAGSFGRVYAGTWNGQPVAVKIITHSSADEPRISQELALSLSFDHRNLVRSLHFTRIRINPTSPGTSLGEPSTVGSSLFLPEGAVGVFNLPSTWAVIQRTAHGGPGPQVDTETWIVMDLMDRGNLAAALRHSNIFCTDKGVMDMAKLLRRAADVAAGVAYLHSRNVCHGDLKCENILLKSQPEDKDGMMAKVADFGLSRALAYGQSHLSTRRYGTVTHMPPELLVAGKLTPAADVYSFGIMMWEFVSRALPFAGMHHGEIIHRVVTEDLRPAPWPEASPELPLSEGYIPLAEACWARQATMRPSMAQVLEVLLRMLEKVEGANSP